MAALEGRALGLALVGGSALLFSFSSLLVRLVEADPWTIVFWRSLFMAAGVTLWLVAAYRARLLGVLQAGGIALLLAGCGHAGAFCFFVLALDRTSVANTVVIMSAAPLVAALLARLLLAEPLARGTVLAMLAASGGIALMFWDSLGSGDFAGNLLALGIALAIGCTIVVLRSRPGADLVPSTVTGGLIAAAVAAVAGSPFAPAPADLVILALMGAGQLALGLCLWTVGARHISAAETGLLTLLEVVLAPLWVWLLLGETASPMALAGGAIVLGALAAETLPFRLLLRRRAVSP